MSFLITATEKIRTIRNNFPPPNPTACPDTSFAGNPLLNVEPVTDEFVLKNNQQCICQVLRTWSHSHHASLWKPWHPLADHHEHHQHISYHWHCTTWSEDCQRQASVEKAIIWQESSEKLPPHFSHFCLKSLKKSFSTNFSPISKKTTSATPFSQPIEQDTALRPFCYVS